MTFKDLFSKAAKEALKERTRIQQQARKMRFSINDLKPSEDAQFIHPERIKRRFILKPEKNPTAGVENIISFRGTFFPDNDTNKTYHVVIRYVPHRQILSLEIFNTYLESFKDSEFGADILSAIMMEDFNSEIIPCWVSVHVTLDLKSDHGLQRFSSLSEDRQRGWSSPLIKRLALVDL